MYNKFEELQGKVLKDCIATEDEVIFTILNGEKYKLYHSQNCCESVFIESVEGHIHDLIGHEILMAEEISNVDEPPLEDSNDSYTWTFYKLATIKGYVTIRFFGTSNGYYSERVDFCKL